MDDRIYLDHAATTPVDEAVLAEMLPYFRETGYNASSLHAEGRRARAALDTARDRVASLLGITRKEVTFTGGGSEADTQAIAGTARLRRHLGRHIVSSRIEHHAVLHTLRALEADGFETTLLPVDRDGLVSPASFAEALRPDTILATIMLANNETGTIEPIRELAAIARERDVLFHTDAVQAAAWLDVAPKPLGVDLLSISAHKFYGPKGVGMLYVREGVPIEPLVYGGGQEFGRRSGTENVAGIVGLAAALEQACRGRDERNARVAALCDRFEAALQRQLEGVRINGAGAPRLPNVSNVSFAGMESETLLSRLDLEGVAVSAGSACTSGVLEPSHVIGALGMEAAWQRGVIRFSLGTSTTLEQIDRVSSLVVRLVSELEGNSLTVRKPRLSQR